MESGTPQVGTRERRLDQCAEVLTMFAFFSNRLGCVGSIIVSVIGTLILFAIMRGCSGGV